MRCGQAAQRDRAGIRIHGDFRNLSGKCRHRRMFVVFIKRLPCNRPAGSRQQLIPTLPLLGLLVDDLLAGEDGVGLRPAQRRLRKA